MSTPQALAHLFCITAASNIVPAESALNSIIFNVLPLAAMSNLPETVSLEVCHIAQDSLILFQDHLGSPNCSNNESFFRTKSVHTKHI